MHSEQICPKPSCFFCTVNEPYSSLRTATLKEYIKGLHFLDDDEELILVVSGLWKVALTRPDNEEFPSLGIFECMASLINKSIHDTKWLLRNQNIYIPYYAAHIIGSYTMNRVDFAVRAVDSGVVPPLMELLRGKVSWIEKRVAIRALGHLASYENTFPAIAVYEEEVVELAAHMASSCFEEVYSMFVVVEDQKRSQYQSDLLTRGVGGIEMENQKAEEWASQMQLWSIHLLNCFAIKERSLGLICNEEFLKKFSEMWGVLVNNPTSPSGIGLIRILCYSKVGREKISKSRNVVANLCKLSRSSDDWQYMAIDCLVLLLKDQDTGCNIFERAVSCLADLVELGSIGNRTNVGYAITKALFYDHNIQHRNSRIESVDIQKTLDEIWDLKIERRKREKVMSNGDIERKRAAAKLIKRQGNEKYLAGAIEEAVSKYSEAMEICPLSQRSERIAIYSNRAQCNLLLRDLDSAISDTTRALSLCSPPNSHAYSLWMRSQAYDMKGMAKASLMDCVLLVNVVCAKSKSSADRARIPYNVVRMISKQMETTWIFRDAQIKALNEHLTEKEKRNSKLKARLNPDVIRIRGHIEGLSTILEEPLAGKDGRARKKMERAKERTKTL